MRWIEKKNPSSKIAKKLSITALATFMLGANFLQNAFAADTLNLDQFLSQVKDNHGGVKGAMIASEAGKLRSEEGQLLLSPTPFAEMKLVSDAKLPQLNFFLYDRLVIQTFSFGVRKQTTFGLQASLHYDILNQYYVNPAISPAFSSGFNATYANASPVLELTQSLWSNGFGKSTQATQEQLEATALASSYQSSFQAKSSLVQAEISYWRLALARQVIEVQQEALDRAKKIYEWNERRARLQLGEKSDVLQSEALVQSRELDLKVSHSEERQASRDFNSMRNIDSDQVQEKLLEINPKLAETLQIPKRAQLRDDVIAAQQISRSNTAAATVSLERDLPTLEVFASVALNAQQPDRPYTTLSDAIPNSFSFNRPTQAVGIRFNTPIDLVLQKKSREGWRREQVAAEMNYSRKVFEQEISWKNLNTQLEDSINQFRLSSKLENIQKSKLNSERDRLQRGRSTTYQVLLFEQDYLQAQLIRIREEAKVLNILAQMKLFGETI